MLGEAVVNGKQVHIRVYNIHNGLNGVDYFGFGARNHLVQLIVLFRSIVKSQKRKKKFISVLVEHQHEIT